MIQQKLTETIAQMEEAINAVAQARYTLDNATEGTEKAKKLGYDDQTTDPSRPVYIPLKRRLDDIERDTNIPKDAIASATTKDERAAARKTWLIKNDSMYVHYLNQQEDAEFAKTIAAGRLVAAKESLSAAQTVLRARQSIIEALTAAQQDATEERRAQTQAQIFNRQQRQHRKH